MFEKLKWKLRGKLKVKKNKLKNEATYVLEFAPEDYKEVIKHFPLINNAVLENFSNEDDFLRIESGQYGIDILNFKIYEGRTKAQREFKFYNSSFKNIENFEIKKIKLHMIKGDEGNEYEVEKIEYYNFSGKKIKIDFKKNIPQYQESDNFILLHSKKKTFNPNIAPLWKEHEDGSSSRIFSKKEYCANFSYNALYKINDFIFRRSNQNYQDIIDVFEIEEELGKKIDEDSLKVKLSGQEELYRYENFIGNLKYFLDEDANIDYFFKTGLPEEASEEQKSSFGRVTGKKNSEIKYLGRLLRNFEYVEVFMSSSKIQENNLEEETNNINGAYPIKIRFLKKNFSEAGEIEFDDYGIATFKRFEEVFSDEKGSYAVISKKN